MGFSKYILVLSRYLAIKIKEKTRMKLERLKLHTKETYSDVIERLLKTQDGELDARTIKNLRKSRRHRTWQNTFP